MRSQHRVPADRRKQIWGLCFLIYGCNLVEAYLCAFFGVGRLFIATAVASCWFSSSSFICIWTDTERIRIVEEEEEDFQK